MPLYLTFDLGTTALKTALVSGDGHLLAVHTEEYTFSCPQPDWAEMEPDKYWNAATTGTREVVRQSGADVSELAGVGFSSQGQTFVPIDSSGSALHRAIVWTDRRAAQVTQQWQAEWLSPEDYRQISGYPWLPAELTVFKLAWLAEHEPQAHKAWKVLLLPDYMIYRLTGETATDRGTAQSSGMFDLRTRDWEPRLLEAAGISREQLPSVLQPGAVAGQLSERAAAELGVPAGVPVCVGANDQVVGAIGAGNVTPGIVSETTGTALALVATTPDLLDDTRLTVGAHPVPGLSFAMPFTTTSAIVLKWFRDLCGQCVGYDEFLNDVGSVPAGCDGLTVLPHFSGTASPTFNPDARGAISGLTLGHTRAHISRAIMESCCCSLSECLDLVRDNGIPVTSIRSLGGAARSDMWLQMKADMLGTRVERPLYSDAASLGAGMLAAVGAGQFGSIAEASQAWYRASECFEPNAGLFDTYREVYRRYLDLYERLYGA